MDELRGWSPTDRQPSTWSQRCGRDRDLRVVAGLLLPAELAEALGRRESDPVDVYVVACE